MKKIYLFAIGVMLLVTSCGHKKEGDATLIRPVKTATASSQSVIRKDFSGIVEAVEYVKLAFRVSGQVINLPVHFIDLLFFLGSCFGNRQGDILVRSFLYRCDFGI